MSLHFETNVFCFMRYDEFKIKNEKEKVLYEHEKSIDRFEKRLQQEFIYTDRTSHRNFNYCDSCGNAAAHFNQGAGDGLWNKMYQQSETGRAVGYVIHRRL